VLALLLSPQIGVAAGPLLTLPAAEQLALDNDPVVAASESRAAAFDADAVADRELPDPTFRTGLYNVPLDDFDLEKAPTTQWRFGVVQKFPRGDTLKFKSQRTALKAEAERHRTAAERQRILRDVRKTWLEAYFQAAARRIIDDSRELFESLTEITQVQYASGGSSQQDVLRAELELSRLDDRIDKLRAQEDVARARLSKWIGDAAWRPLPAVLPSLPEVPAQAEIAKRLVDHPEVEQQLAKQQMSKKSVAIAQEQYKPGWAVGAEYRKRFGDNPDGSSREDMAAVMLTVDLPLFTDKRQDQRLTASEKRLQAASLARDDTLRKLRQQLASAEALRKRLEERLVRYDGKLLNEARENASAALQAYQSRTTDFTALMRARITELEMQIQALKLRVDLMKTEAGLLYLSSGEKK
jgi:outer membrane protein TolC